MITNPRSLWSLCQCPNFTTTYSGLTPVARLAWCLKCQSASRHFQPREDPSRGLLRDYENFADGSFAALTQTRNIADLARLSLTNPVLVSVHENASVTTPENLRQSYIVAEVEHKV